MRGPRLVSVTGASNVTGELWPYEELTRVAHRHGARLLLDAAQLAPHRPINMAATDVDYVAFSGHKLYAPFGAGVLVGRRDWLAEGHPMLAGGGAVRFVSVDDVLWAEPPDRAEPGTPNIVGAVALGVACRTLAEADRDLLAATETALVDDAQARLAAIPGVRCHRLWTAAQLRIGVLTFTLRGIGYARLAAALSAEHGIGVRHGCFCAHPLVSRLLGRQHPCDGARRARPRHARCRPPVDRTRHDQHRHRPAHRRGRADRDRRPAMDLSQLTRRQGLCTGSRPSPTPDLAFELA